MQCFFLRANTLMCSDQLFFSPVWSRDTFTPLVRLGQHLVRSATSALNTRFTENTQSTRSVSLSPYWPFASERKHRVADLCLTVKSSLWQFYFSECECERKCCRNSFIIQRVLFIAPHHLLWDNQFDECLFVYLFTLIMLLCSIINIPTVPGKVIILHKSMTCPNGDKHTLRESKEIYKPNYFSKI